MKTMRRSNCILFIKMMILSTLAFSCRGLNDRKVDPVVIAHAKAVIDSNFLHSPYLQVAQYEFNTAWLYIIAPKHSFWFWTEKGGPDNAYELPTDFLEYKGKFIFFFYGCFLSGDLMLNVYNSALYLFFRRFGVFRRRPHCLLILKRGQIFLRF